MRLYLNKTVLEAAQERIAMIFDRYTNVVVSVSGGKDSTVLADLVWREAQRRNRVFHAFFLDQEAEYQATIDVIRGIMARPGVVPHWYQVPIKMTSAVSYAQDFLYAWGPGEPWMRAKDPLAIHAIDEAYPQRFYPFIDWFESQWGPDTCFLVGLRAEESLHRLRAVIANPGVEGIPWSTGTAPTKFYPVYDLSFDDVFHYLWLFQVPYNRIYDWMHANDPAEQITKYRVSNLIHERAYTSLVDLQRFEPDTYERLQARLAGVRTAARYAGEATIYSTNERPAAFPTWRAYRDYLLTTIPIAETHRATFAKRFASQGNAESVARQQVRQLLLNDWENNLPVTRQSETEAADWRQKWWDLL